MRVLMSAVLLGLLMSLAAAVSPASASAPCAVEYENAMARFKKVQMKLQKKKNIIDKINADLRSAERAKAAGDEKECHAKINKAMSLAEKHE